MYEYSNKFRNELNSVADSCRPSQAYRVVVPESIEAVEALKNRRIVMDELAAVLKMSCGSVHHLMHDILNFYKVSPRWVPKQLTPKLNNKTVMHVKNFCAAMKY